MLKTIIPGLYTFTGMLVGRVYMTEDADGVTIIDASIAPSGKNIIKQLRASGRQPSDVKRILITHGHPDHIGGLPYLTQETGAQVMAHAIEAPVIRGETDIPRPSRDSLPGITRFMLPPKTTPKPSPVHRELQDGDVIAESFGGLHAIHTPGHAPGHISYWQPDKKVLFVGDVLMRLPQMRLPFAMLTVDMEEDKRSVKKIAELGAEVACFGHGAPMRDMTAMNLREFAAHL